jgi:ATP-binding cassette subfamily F protein 3
LINPGNLLLMDEPTNHLDLDSSEALAESLTSYDGTLVFVSHNRSFVRRLATLIWNVEGGRVDTYPGTLDEYMDSCRRRIAGGADADKPTAKAGALSPGPAPAKAPQAQKPERGGREAEKERKRQEAQSRLGRSEERKLQSEVSRLEQEIAALESAQAERSSALADPDVYADKARSQSLIEAFRDAQQALELLQSRWEQALTELEAVKALAVRNGAD